MITDMIGDSPLGKKETYGDTGACLSRYVCVPRAHYFGVPDFWRHL